MFELVCKSVLRRPFRTGLTIAGVALAVAVLSLIDQAGAAYKAELSAELNKTGIHLMMVPLGCPYDAAARVLKGNSLESSLPHEALEIARGDPAVEIAAPLLIASVPRPEQGRVDLFVGIDDSGIALRRWWRAESGRDRFNAANEIILGVDAAMVEMRSAGETLYSPETKERFVVSGILQRSGTSDDSRFFLPLETAQRIFNSPDRLTAVAIRLRDPDGVREATERLRDLRGVQVVTSTEMMGTFVRILGTVRTFLRSIALVALCASALGLANTLLMSVAERRFEFSLFRAIGASRLQVSFLIALESLMLALAGAVAGLILAFALEPGLKALLLRISSFPLEGRILGLDATGIIRTLGLATFLAVIVSLLPAWRAASSPPAGMLKGAD